MFYSVVVTTLLFDFQETEGVPGGQRSRWTINPVIELSGDPTDTAVASRPGGLERSAFIV